jgi:hypothetical protein
MRDPHLIVLGESLKLFLVDGATREFAPSSGQEYYNYGIHNGVIEVCHWIYQWQCPKHPLRIDCILGPRPTYCGEEEGVCEWSRFFPLAIVTEMQIKRKPA